MKTRCRLAIIDVGLTVTTRDARNTLTSIAIDEIDTCAIVLTWARLAFIDIHRAVATYTDTQQEMCKIMLPDKKKSHDPVCRQLLHFIFSIPSRWKSASGVTPTFDLLTPISTRFIVLPSITTVVIQVKLPRAVYKISH